MSGGSFGSGLWRSIFKTNDEFQGMIEFQVGRGNRVLFWLHVLCRAVVLNQAFLDIFSFALCKDGMVEEHVVRTGDSRAWNLHLRRALNDWEIPAVSCLMARLDRVQIVDPSSEDTMYWPFYPNGRLFVKFMSMMEDRVVLQQRPFHFIWGSNVPSKVCFLLGILYLGKALTRDNLIKKGVPVVNRCNMCKKHEESLGHLFCHCPLL